MNDEEWQKYLEAARARMDKGPTRQEIMSAWIEFYNDRFLWFVTETWCRLVYCPIKGHKPKIWNEMKCINCQKQGRLNGNSKM